MGTIKYIDVCVHSQTLLGFSEIPEQQVNGAELEQVASFQCKVATATNGVGQANGSECTPLGSHRIRAKIGTGAEENTVFIGRRASGEVYSEELAVSFPSRDWILSRILWLCGNETGFNRGGYVDTQRRYVYIHGAPDSHPMGKPSSHGCIKMRNSDIISLFDKVTIGTIVEIKEKR